MANKQQFVVIGGHSKETVDICKQTAKQMCKSTILTLFKALGPSIKIGTKLLKMGFKIKRLLGPDFKVPWELAFFHLSCTLKKGGLGSMSVQAACYKVGWPEFQKMVPKITLILVIMVILTQKF